jgi:hypothetical protein
VGTLKFKQKDKNRFRKVYPFLRRKPVYELVVIGDANIEVGVIDYNNTDTGTHTFTAAFISVPVITAIAVEESSMPGSTSGNINVYVSAVSTTEVTIKVSDANFVGRVHFHAILAS